MDWEAIGAVGRMLERRGGCRGGEGTTGPVARMSTPDLEPGWRNISAMVKSDGCISTPLRTIWCCGGWSEVKSEAWQATVVDEEAKARLDAIGESNRMTLKFRKPE